MNHKPDIKEGQCFNYRILKQVKLSETEKFYLLEDDFGRKQLMPSEYYINYGFKIGDEITCRVDHVNCSGKIFLEPEHPHYKEGEIYSFSVNQSYISQNRFGDDIRIIEVRDVFGELAVCKIEDVSVKFKIDSEAEFKIERIKKGKLYLSYVKDKTFPALVVGGYYRFKIIDKRELADNRIYYILNDKEQNTYLLNCEYYKHHNLSTGQELECVVQKFSSKGYYVLEPRHPFYEIGNEYSFNIDRQFSISKVGIIDAFEVIVKDKFDEEVRFVNEGKIESQNIICKVTGIKKGKPLLSFLK